ncbi:MAG: hypothetical protein ACM3SO_02655 [Betaproteobacteria bacterium]
MRSRTRSTGVSAGVEHRYGRRMQVIISGIHYNISFADNVWPLLQSARDSAIEPDVRQRRARVPTPCLRSAENGPFSAYEEV